jgi:hypothetical protein
MNFISIKNSKPVHLFSNRVGASIIVILFVVSFSLFSFSQTKTTSKKAGFQVPNSYLGSPAYAEVLLKKTEVEAEYEALLIDYTEEYPKVKENKLALRLLLIEIEKLSKIDSSQMPKLTLALGKLIVKKVEVEVEVKALLLEYDEKNRDVLRARKKLQIYEKAIAEIMN